MNRAMLRNILLAVVLSVLLGLMACGPTGGPPASNPPANTPDIPALVAALANEPYSARRAALDELFAVDSTVFKKQAVPQLVGLSDTTIVRLATVDGHLLRGKVSGGSGAALFFTYSLAEGPPALTVSMPHSQVYDMYAVVP